MEMIPLKEVPKEMQNRIVNAMYRTWEAIGDDLLQCVADCGGKIPIPRSEVIECVCDAGRMGPYGGDKEAYEISKKLSWNDLKKLGKVAFPFAKYGY